MLDSSAPEYYSVAIKHYSVVIPQRDMVSTYLGEFEQLVLFAILSLRDNAYGVTIREEIHSRTGVDAEAG